MKTDRNTNTDIKTHINPDTHIQAHGHRHTDTQEI